jgi:ABC-type polar amino acid transport system ATPase subunit
MIQFDHVSKVYSGGHMALQKVSFQLRSGEMAFLTGHSGAGKSTLLKLISVQERPSDGRILFNRRDLSQITKADVPLSSTTWHCHCRSPGPHRWKFKNASWLHWIKSICITKLSMSR